MGSRYIHDYFGINHKAISIYARLELIVEVVYSSIDYSVHTISKILYTMYFCVHT